MPATKLCSSGTLDTIKSGGGNDTLDTFIRQATGKEPLLPFSRTVDTPVQWIQLLHALEQPDLPGWPLLAPVKVQMLKCEKCSQEFCSPINYRRHSRVHRRSLNINKECPQNRDILAAFWDKLSVEQAKEVVSFDDVMLKEIPGSSLTTALASSLRKPGVWTFPQLYVKAGATLLDIIQVKPSTLPISSEELFSILDDASERTFLCGGAAESVQKFVFYGETVKDSIDLKNIVATTSFLLEQKLVKAWIAEKDAEALRCQKLLVEEEEAAQKRQALLLERKKQKKLRQKEQKAREQFDGCNEDLNVNVDVVDRPTSTEASGPSSPSDSTSTSPDMPTNLDSFSEPMPPQRKESDQDIEANVDFNPEHIEQGDSHPTKLQMVAVNSHRHFTANRWQIPKSHRSSQHVNPNLQTLKPEPVRKVWTKKLKIDSDGEKTKPPPLQREISHQIKENNCEVLIGSISVTLNGCVAQNQETSTEAQDIGSTEHHPVLKKKNASEKIIKANNNVHSGTTRVSSKLWRPVSHREIKIDRGNEDSQRSNQSQFTEEYRALPDENGQQQQCLPFSSVAAKEFLAKRWKEAIAADHVTLVLSGGPENPGCSDRSVQVQFGKKPDKSVKLKYIPKHKAVA